MAGVKELAHRRERRLAHEKTRRRIAMGVLQDEPIVVRPMDAGEPAESCVTYGAGAGLMLRASIAERIGAS